MRGDRGSVFIIVMLMTATLFGLCASLLIITGNNRVTVSHYVQSNRVFYNASGVTEQIHTHLEQLSQTAQIEVFKSLKNQIDIFVNDCYNHDTEQLDIAALYQKCINEYFRLYTLYVNSGISSIKQQLNTANTMVEITASSTSGQFTVTAEVIVADGGSKKKICTKFALLSMGDCTSERFDKLINMGIINNDAELEYDNLVNVKMLDWREEII